MSPGRPQAILTADGRRLTAAEAGLAELTVDLALGRHDAARLALWPRSKLSGTAPGATIAIALGDAGREQDVLTGEIAALRAGPDGLMLEALGATAALARERRSQTYVGQTAADIVRDLVGAAALGEVEAALALEAYAVDDRRTVWAHILDLARLVDADVGANASGKLRFVPIGAGPPAHRFRFGAEVLDWRLERNAPVKALAVAAHGAGSEAGAARWHWLLNDPVGAGGSPVFVLGALRTRDAAEKVAGGLMARAERGAVSGRVRIVGDPGVRPGDRLELMDLPDGNPGPLRALEVRHRLGGAIGFTTLIVVEAAGTAGGFPS